MSYGLARRCRLRLLAAISLAAVTAWSQQNSAAPNSDSANPETVFQVTSELVQIDAVVTDGKGNHVTDLTAEDFELFQDDAKQTITHFSYISAESPPAPKNPANDRNRRAVAPAPELPREQVKRTIAIVVDDFNLNWESTAYARQAVKRFVEKNVRSGDLVSILRTGDDAGARQQFMSDPTLLRDSAERIRWNPSYADFNYDVARASSNSLAAEDLLGGWTFAGCR